MDNDQHLVIKIAPSGKVDVEANNFNGVGCTEATEQIEIALGSKVDKKFKPEYHNPAVSNIAASLSRDF